MAGLRWLGIIIPGSIWGIVLAELNPKRGLLEDVALEDLPYTHMVGW